MNRPTARTTAAATVFLLLAFLAPAAAPAQPPADEERPPREWRAGLRLGAFEMINSSDTYDAIFGDPMPMLGAQVEWEPWPRLLVGLSLDYGRVTGELVRLSDPPTGTGVGAKLTYIPVHLTAAWRADRGGDWAVHLGAGPSWLSWDFDSRVSTSDGSETGGHLLVSLRRLRESWIFGGELRWSSFPDAIGDAEASKFFGDDDAGGLALQLVALRRF